MEVVPGRGFPRLTPPVVPQVRNEVARALFGEEDLRPLDLDDVPRAGDHVPQLVRPLDAERGVARSPDQQRRRLEGAQPGAGR